VARLALDHGAVIKVHVYPAIRPMAARALAVIMARRCLTTVTSGTIRKAGMVEPRLAPSLRSVTVRALAAIVVRLSMAAHTIGEPRMAERNQPPALTTVTISARTGIVLRRQNIPMTIITVLKASMVERGLFPIVRAMAVGTLPWIMPDFGRMACLAIRQAGMIKGHGCPIKSAVAVGALPVIVLLWQVPCPVAVLAVAELGVVKGYVLPFVGVAMAVRAGAWIFVRI
jgi:hypothetical protein